MLKFPIRGACRQIPVSGYLLAEGVVDTLAGRRWRVGLLLTSAHSSISDRKLTNIDMVDIVQ